MADPPEPWIFKDSTYAAGIFEAALHELRLGKGVVVTRLRAA